MRDEASREDKTATTVPHHRETIWEDMYTFTTDERDPDQLESLRLGFRGHIELLLTPGGHRTCFWVDFFTCVPWT